MKSISVGGAGRGRWARRKERQTEAEFVPLFPLLQSAATSGDVCPRQTGVSLIRRRLKPDVRKGDRIFRGSLQGFIIAAGGVCGLSIADRSHRRRYVERVCSPGKPVQSVCDDKVLHQTLAR